MPLPTQCLAFIMAKPRHLFRGAIGFNLRRLYVQRLQGQACQEFNWVASDAGLDSAFLDTIYGNYESQFDWLDKGAVVAAPDNDTPGGDYEYHWMRDGALSIKGLMDINNDNLEAFRSEKRKKD